MPDNPKALSQADRLKKCIPYLFVLLVVLLDVALSRYTKQTSLLVPQTAAIAAGFLLVPSVSFIDNGWKALVLSASGAALGILFANLAGLPVFVRLPVVCLLCEALLLAFSSSFTPVIALACYPVLYHVTSLYYIPAAAALCALVLVLQRLLLVLHLQTRAPALPAVRPDRSDLVLPLARTLIVFLLVFLPAKTSFPLLLVPELLSSFWDFSDPSCTSRRMPMSTVILLAMGAVAGVFCQVLLRARLGVPTLVCVLISCLLVFFFYVCFGAVLPQALAIALLSYTIPAGQFLFFPIRIFAGASLFMALSALLFRKNKAARTAKAAELPEKHKE
ncbi:MAG TPA: hypothetical protein DGX96_12120 [Lachnospiraceae bacterium]|nr:hypothetical protein [Lachnospiraceae bacterium]